MPDDQAPAPYKNLYRFQYRKVYAVVMARYEFTPGTQVMPTSEARAELSPTLARFRHAGFSAEPVVFGSHRKAEAVVLPYGMFERLLPAIEDILLAESVRERLAEPAESEDFDEFVAAELGYDLSDFA